MPEDYNFKAAVFDLDGVVTQTSHLHEEAWKQVFNDFLQKKKNEAQSQGTAESGKRDETQKEGVEATDAYPFSPFAEADYLKFVDGRPRTEGITNFLNSRAIELPTGDPSDTEDMETVMGLGNRKNRIFNALLKDKGVFVYKSTVELIKELKRMGVKIGVASSSKNCKPIIARADIECLFSVVIDGVVSESLGLPGKPEPDIFTKCAELLGVHPRESIMVEDAVSGVKAGKAGNFGLVVGVDRAYGKNRQRLLDAGADVVLDDFAQVTPGHLNDFFLPNDAGYVIQFDNYDPKQERLREALCTLGNGYFATRGCLEEARADADEHYPGTYMARGWNKEISKVEERDVANEDLVNLPNWTHVTFRPEGKEWFSWTRDAHGDLPFEMSHYDTRLDLHQGLLARRYRVKDEEGRITMIMSHRVVHMKEPHVGMIKYTLIPENWSGQIHIASEIDGSVRNTGVPRYIGLQDKHLRVLRKGKFPLSVNEGGESKDQGVYIVARFTEASLEIAMAARTQVYIGTSNVPLDNWLIEDEEKLTQIFSVAAEQGCIIQVEKLMSLYCSKDQGVGNVAESAINQIQRHCMERYSNIISVHKKIWTQIWRRIDIEIELTPEGASPTLKREHLAVVEKEQRGLRVLSGSEEEPLAEEFFKAPTGTTMGGRPSGRKRTIREVGKPLRSRSESPMLGPGHHFDRAKDKMERVERQPLTTYSQIASATNEKELLAIASRHLQLVLRFNAFHLVETVSFNTIGLDTSIPARGLHGESYRGHIFWDELFVFPICNLRLPEVTRTLLLYRFYRLDAARDRAKQLGYSGACYPWQSSSTGREETQQVHYNPLNKTWGPDYSSNQLHVNIAVFYNIWDYYNVTGDRLFMALYGAEIMLEIARFWGLKATFNEKTDRYDIDGVMGPDEFHEKYPDTDKAGLKNNAYTNVMVAWLLDKALRVLELLPESRREEVMNRLHLTKPELDRWEHITLRLSVPFLADFPGIIAQFEGWDQLLDLNWAAYRRRYGKINRMDRILKSEGDSPDRYKLSKQADTCMLFYLLPEQELLRIFAQLGYAFTRDLIHKNIAYYLKRTCHGSTLSYVVFAHVLHKFNPKKAWKFYRTFIMSDIADTQGGTTSEGIHVVPLAASINMLLMQFCGIDTSYNAVRINPHLTNVISHLSFRFSYQNQWLQVKLSDSVLTVAIDGDSAREDKVPILIGDTLHFLLPGSKMQFHLT